MQLVGGQCEPLVRAIVVRHSEPRRNEWRKRLESELSRHEGAIFYGGLAGGLFIYLVGLALGPSYWVCGLGLLVNVISALVSCHVDRLLAPADGGPQRRTAGGSAVDGERACHELPARAEAQGAVEEAA